MDAAARLRYMTGIQTRTRRAALLPWFALLWLGAVVAAHGALAALWPHSRAVTLAWIGALVAIRPLVRWLRRRLADRRGLYGSRRLRVACSGAALLAAAAAIAVGASPLVCAIALATALPAYLGGLPEIAVAVVAAGAIAVAVSADVTPAAGDLTFGAGLIALGLAARARDGARR
jgi:hypothetical protein